MSDTKRYILSMPAAPLLHLNSKEERVYSLLMRSGAQKMTPLLLSKRLYLPRSTVYVTLAHLRERGLVTKHGTVRKNFWTIADRYAVKRGLEHTSDFLLRESSDIEHAGPVAVFSGKKALGRLLERIFGSHPHAALWTFQSSTAEEQWAKHFTQQELSHYHRLAIQRKLVSRHVLETGIFEKAAEVFGVNLLKNYKGRPSSMHVLPSRYMTHHSALFVILDSVYFINVEALIAIEIKNADIVAMMKHMLEYIMDASNPADLNAQLASLIAKRSGPQL